MLLHPFFLSLRLPPCVELRLQVFATEGDICIVIELVSSLPRTESFATVGKAYGKMGKVLLLSA